MWSIECNRFFFLISLQKRTPFFGRQSVRLTRAYAYDKKYIRFNHMLRNERKKRSTKGKNISQYFYFAVAINVKVKSTYIHISSSLFYSVVHVIRKMCILIPYSFRRYTIHRWYKLFRQYHRMITKWKKWFVYLFIL